MDSIMIIHYILLVIQLWILVVTYKAFYKTDASCLKRKVRERDVEISKLVADNKRLLNKNDRLLKRLADSLSVGYTYKTTTKYK